MREKNQMLWGVLVIVCAVSCCGARTWNVGVGAGYDFAEIQPAIDAAQEGDTIVVSRGQYPGGLEFRGRNITLRSTDPDDPEVVADTWIHTPEDDNDAMITRVRAITLTGQEDPNCVIQGLTLSGRASSNGGGILGQGSLASILQCRITWCRARYGGGLHNCDGLIKDCVVAANEVLIGAKGGGLYGCDGQIIGCLIERNRAGNDGNIGSYVPTPGYGGGLAHCNGLIQGCHIRENFCFGQGEGGGLYGCDGRIMNCWIEDNYAGYGEGAESTLGDGGGMAHCAALVQSCTITKNTAFGKGGGLFECSGTISQSTIHENGAIFGAGLYGCSGDVSNCTVQSNIASEIGGGLHSCLGLVSDCLIRDNRAELWHGGGVVLCENLVRCNIVSNQARGYGGGVYDCNALTSCVISDNRAEVFPGGGVHQARSVVSSLIMGNVSGDEGGACYDVGEIDGCTIVGNSAASQGGAVVFQGDVGIITNSIVWDNASGSGSQIVVATDSEAPVIIQYSDIQGGLEGVAVSESSVLAWLDGNLDTDPHFQDSGERTESGQWQAGNYRLLDTSPCINAGDPNVLGADQNDLDGRSRVIDGIIDMGAYEYEFVPVLLQSIVVNGPERVIYGRPVQYTATAYYDNRSVADVTDLAQWSVSPDTVGVIEAGQLQLLPLDGTTQFTVHATYAEGDLVSDANLVVQAGPGPWTGATHHVDTLTGRDTNRGRSRADAWATIQHAIDRAGDGDTILVWPGVYREGIRFKGKAVTVQSAGDAAVLENPGGLAVSFLHGEGLGSVLRNFVIRDSVSGVFMVAASPTLANLTVVGNERGIECYESQPIVTHCIVWDNSEIGALGCQPQYSWPAIPGPVGDESMHVRDPLFVAPDAGDYHLKSQAGHWDADSEIWVFDGMTSPCIDAGNWYNPVGRETFPNGGIVNLGAYGGTATASRSYFGKPVCPVIMAGDINGDCIVDEWDMELLLLRWLEEFDEDVLGGGR